MMLKWCFHKKILRNISQNLLQEFSCTLHKTTANTGFFSPYSPVSTESLYNEYEKIVQKIYRKCIQSYSARIRENTVQKNPCSRWFCVVVVYHLSICDIIKKPKYCTCILFANSLSHFCQNHSFCCEIACSTHYFLNFYMISCSWKPFRNQEVSISIF